MIIKHLIRLCAIAVIFSLFIIPANTISFSHHMMAAVNNSADQVIRVALYDTWGRNNRYIEDILNYTWATNNFTYQFHVTTLSTDAVADIENSGNITLTNENFDVFIIGASADSYLVDGQDATWKNNVQQFVENGGGYLGICGGANAASQGFENPQNWFHRRVNKGILGLADVYINDNFLSEWQYLMKFGFGGSDFEYPSNTVASYISVNTSVEENPENKIFKE